MTEPHSEAIVDRIPAEVQGAAGMSGLCALLLGWATLGSPPYSFFDVMRWAVAATCSYWAWILWRRSPALAPVCLALLVAAGLYVLGDLKKAEWPPINVLTGSLLLVIAGVSLTPNAKAKRWISVGFIIALLAGLSLQAVSSAGGNVLWFWQSDYWKFR